MVAEAWYGAVKEALRMPQKQWYQNSQENMKPAYIILELQDSFASTEHRFGVQPTLAKHDVHAEGPIHLPVDSQYIDITKGATSTYQAARGPTLIQSFPASTSERTPASSSSSTPNTDCSYNLSSDQRFPSRSISIQAAPRGTRRSALKAVCVQCHVKKKKCDGVFPCKRCRCKDEHCVERVNKRRKKIARGTSDSVDVGALI
ncbi:hypothetical protein L226DRAFT_537475 [Lentinus tigrinus ALCF2SS1-7]|uniref:uncharacterized protein n=1 Tax=Lentinus tigrinus ALCF2SS1-7 TaxID=1328758 RepID=UPI001165CDDD|nr:hypothetical protein L226DRAFT_537475 [Lentinus tigrinus ALCF2SS1-7]